MRSIVEVPGAVRQARTLWFVAVGAGVFETVLVVASGRAGDGAVAGVALRAVVFGAALFTTLRMYRGQRWARLALAVGLGVLGTLSIVVDPLLWLAGGNSLTAVIRDSGGVDLLFGASRVLHVAAVLSACALMFTPKANAYFR
ncbi:hypothetical protein [Dactylosporangium sp. CS-033363]|uniref:hypothetical protein n=1 Tax=Dactylosporangium sp. CS-033363 TaxID=3239935 RepID=UPI003D9002B8